MFFSSKRTSLLMVVCLLVASLNVVPADSPASARNLPPPQEFLTQPVPQAAPAPVAVQPKAKVNVPQKAMAPVAGNTANPSSKRISLTLRDTPIVEVFDMLARSEKLSIVLGKGVTGNISVSLYDVTLDQAIRSAAEAGGYVAEHRGKTWLVIDRGDLGKEEASSETVVKTFKIQYSTNVKLIADILTKHLSRYGKVTPLQERNMLVVEDRPDNLAKLAGILDEIDKEPRQILIEAKILQVDLTDEDQFGINWNKLFGMDAGRNITSGVRGYDLPTSGFFATAVGGGLQGTLAALSKRNNVRTLSTPRLLAIEGQQSIVQIGGQRGYKVTTTINMVTTESIQFLDAGVILKVTPFVDDGGRIHMRIQPEVSDYDFVAGVPGKKTTTVQTSAIASNGETIFIGGLIKGKSQKDRQGVPLVSDVPVLGSLFSYQTRAEDANETVVLITPYLVEESHNTRFEFAPDKKTKQFLDERTKRLDLMQQPESARQPELQAAPAQLPPGTALPLSQEKTPDSSVQVQPVPQAQVPADLPQTPSPASPLAPDTPPGAGR